MPRSRVLGFLLLLTTFAAGCGQSGVSGAASTTATQMPSAAASSLATPQADLATLDACTLIPAATVRAATGVAVADGVSENGDGERRCTFGLGTDSQDAVGLAVQDRPLSLAKAEALLNGLPSSAETEPLPASSGQAAWYVTCNDCEDFGQRLYIYAEPVLLAVSLTPDVELGGSRSAIQTVAVLALSTIVDTGEPE